MITPTVGRIVNYHPANGDPGDDGSNEPLAAIICYVWSPTVVNLAIFDRNGHRYARTSVSLMQPGDMVGPIPYAEWMPFQRGQAAAADTPGGIMDRVAALERTLALLTEQRG